jgi:hypothetical protein
MPPAAPSFYGNKLFQSTFIALLYPEVRSGARVYPHRAADTCFDTQTGMGLTA